VGLPGEFTGRGFNHGDSMIRKMYVYDEEMMQYTMLLVGSKKNIGSIADKRIDGHPRGGRYLHGRKIYNLKGCDAAKFVGN
jgi:hypothetical protein